MTTRVVSNFFTMDASFQGAAEYFGTNYVITIESMQILIYPRELALIQLAAMFLLGLSPYAAVRVRGMMRNRHIHCQNSTLTCSVRSLHLGHYKEG